MKTVRKSKSNGYDTTSILDRSDRKIRKMLARLKRNGAILYTGGSKDASEKLLDIASANGLTWVQEGAYLAVFDSKTERKFRAD